MNDLDAVLSPARKSWIKTKHIYICISNYIDETPNPSSKLVSLLFGHVLLLIVSMELQQVLGCVAFTLWSSNLVCWKIHEHLKSIGDFPIIWHPCLIFLFSNSLLSNLITWNISLREFPITSHCHVWFHEIYHVCFPPTPFGFPRIVTFDHTHRRVFRTLFLRAVGICASTDGRHGRDCISTCSKAHLLVLLIWLWVKTLVPGWYPKLVYGCLFPQYYRFWPIPIWSICGLPVCGSDKVSMPPREW